jgi:hypothetical protein
VHGLRALGYLATEGRDAVMAPPPAGLDRSSGRGKTSCRRCAMRRRLTVAGCTRKSRAAAAWDCRPMGLIAMMVACCCVFVHAARGAATMHALELLARQAAAPATPSPAGRGGPHLPHPPTGFAAGERAPRGEDSWLKRVSRGRSGLERGHEALRSTMRAPPIGDASPTIAGVAGLCERAPERGCGGSHTSSL